MPKQKNQVQASLHDLLKRELKLKFNKELQLGRLRLVVVSEPIRCEGICTPETEEEYQARPGPPSPDFVVRGFCGPKTIEIGETAVQQTLKGHFEYPIDQLCCLACAISADVLRIVSG